MMTQQEKSQIKQVLQSPSWLSVQHCAEELIRNIQDEFVVKDDQWETLKNTVSREARVQGIRDFIQKLYENAQ